MSKLNTEQLQAVNSNSDRILCLAGGGAGKTRVLIERISRLVSDGVAPSSILTLTFTNAAAAEMRSRYENSHVGQEIPEFKTFHAFCYSLMCKDPAIRSALGYTTAPGIASEEQEKVIEKQVLLQCKIDLSKDKLINRIGLTRQEQQQVELYDKAKNRQMLMHNVITFDALNEKVSELFASGHPATKPYVEQYKYIAVDEYQDTDPVQTRFLNAFPEANLYFTGDTLQNIFSFRGTSNELIKVLANTPDWEVIKLSTNYRSTNQICDYANEFSKKYADISYRVVMKGTRDGAKVTTKLVNGPAKYSAVDSKDISDVIKELEGLSGTSAILCRTNREVSAIVSYLKDKGIEYTTNREDRFQKLIEGAISDSYAKDYLAAYLPSNKYGEYIKLATQTKSADLNWFLGLYGDIPQVAADAKKIAELRRIAEKFCSMEDKVAAAAKVLGVVKIPVPDKLCTGLEFLKHLKSTVSASTSSELYVGTIHSVKGLEYDNVFVMNVGSYNFKLNTEDEKNLFYVAITRAKNKLFVYELFADY